MSFVRDNWYFCDKINIDKMNNFLIDSKILPVAFFCRVKSNQAKGQNLWPFISFNIYLLKGQNLRPSISFNIYLLKTK